MSSGAAARLEETRTLVASLQTAVDFVKQLSESLAVVTQLLASATLTDVQEAITFLIYCHKFQVTHKTTCECVQIYLYLLLCHPLSCCPGHDSCVQVMT